MSVRAAKRAPTAKRMLVIRLYIMSVVPVFVWTNRPDGLDDEQIGTIPVITNAGNARVLPLGAKEYPLALPPSELWNDRPRLSGAFEQLDVVEPPAEVDPARGLICCTDIAPETCIADAIDAFSGCESLAANREGAIERLLRGAPSEPKVDTQDARRER